MFSRILLLPLLSSTVLLTGCDIEFGDGDRFQRDFHETRAFQPGERLSVETFNGQVDIVTWDQNSVDISGTKSASSEQLLDDIKVDIQQGGGALAIRSIRPSLIHGSMGVRFTLRVPKRLVLDHITTSNGGIHVSNVDGSANLKTSNGGIHAEHLNGRLDAQTSNGKIEVNFVNGPSVFHTSNGAIEGSDIAGPVDATTSNGAIHLQLASGAASGPLRFSTSNGGIDVSLQGPLRNEMRVHTSNGGITLRLPSDVNAHVHAATSNASITTEFPIAMEGTENKHQLEGNIGSGGPQIEITNSNSGIHLLRAGR